MPLESDRWGQAIADAIKTVDVPQDSFITDAKREEIWKKITAQDKIEIDTNADLELQAGDIPVDPGTFTTPSGAVTGVGASEAVTLTGRIK